MDNLLNIKKSLCYEQKQFYFLPGQGSEPELATHVLQFIFISEGYLRFPVAEWPSGNCTPSDLYHLFWKGVLRMVEIGFT